MALDCSPEKQIFLTRWKNIFKVFCIYIYIYIYIYISDPALCWLFIYFCFGDTN